MIAIPDDLRSVKGVKVEVLETPVDLYNDFARVVANKIRENNSLGKTTALIVPVGPTGQYRRLARLCNIEGISCRNLVTFNMDEYCTEDGQAVPYDHPMSFRSFMDREFFSLLSDDKKSLEQNRVLPDPNDTGAIERKIAEVGGIDICFGGIGITGHIAFNEAAEDDISPDEFRNLPTRVLNVARETKVVNSIFGTRGNLESMPSKAITIGMRELLSSRELHFYLDWPWQSAVLRRTLLGPVTPRFPASFVRTHPNCTITVTSSVAEIPQATPE